MDVSRLPVKDEIFICRLTGLDNYEITWWTDA